MEKSAPCLSQERRSLRIPYPQEEKWWLVVSEGTILSELQKDKLSPAMSDETRLSWTAQISAIPPNV